MDDMITLRELIEADKEIIFEWISNPELRKMTGTRGIPTREKHEIWFADKKSDQSNIIRVIMYDRHPVGIIGTNEMNMTYKNANIYLYIGNTTYRNKGIGTAALNLMKDLLFGEYHCHKITAAVFSYNAPSINLFKKSGYICEGIQKEQIIFDGHYYDRVLFGLINKND